MAEHDTQELDRPEAEDEGDYALDRATVAAILDAVEAGDAARLTALMEPLHAADIADLLEQIGPEEREALVRLYGREFDGDILSEIDEGIREEIVSVLSPEVLTDAVRELDTDDVVDLIEDLEAPQQQAVLDALDRADRAAVEKALTYPEYSAGRLMQRELVMGPEHWTVGEAIDYLRSRRGAARPVLPHDPGQSADAAGGQCHAGPDPVSSKRDVKLKDIAEEMFRTFHVEEEEGDVAYAFNQYHLISAPVVDDDDRLVGVITIDDAMTVLDEEHEEDILRLAGVGESSISDRVVDTVRQRVPWLFVNLLTAILAATVIAQFEGVDRQGGGAGGADADRRLDGRQCRHPGADRGGARHRHPRPDRRQRSGGWSGARCWWG